MENNKINHLNCIYQMYKDTNISHCYQILDNEISLEEATQILKNDMTKYGIDIHNIIFQKVWEYFPHVTTESLNDGFYDKLDKLQGVNGIYYVGGLLNFEDVENVACFSEYLVNRFFR